MFSMKSFAVFTLSAAFAMVSLNAHADEPLAESHFDDDTEGWTVAGFNERVQLQPHHSNGSLHIADYSDGDTWYWNAGQSHE
jgi:hypothetical protein